jgi:hypothetical protein
MSKSKDLWLLLLAVIIVITVLVVAIKVINTKTGHHEIEHFMGIVPSASQTSAIPKDIPGAVTSDPTIAKPEIKDMISAQQIVEGFQDIFNIGEGFGDDDEADLLMENAPQLLKTIEKFIENPENTALPTSFDSMVNGYLKKAQALRKSDKAVPVSKIGSLPAELEGFTNPPAPTQIGSNPGKITMEDLNNLIKKISAERLRMVNLRSTAPTIQQKVARLASMESAVRTFKSKVERKQMRIEDVPINPIDARKFLQTNLQFANELPNLVLPSGVASKSITTSKTTTLPTDKLHQAIPTATMMEMLQNLKWSFEIKIDNDPTILERERIMKRIEALEKRIAAYAYSETPIPKYMQRILMKELTAMSNALTASMYKNDSDDNEDSDGEKKGKAPWDTRMMPKRSNDDPGSRGNYDSDSARRPGFVMDSDGIARRASSSAFDESKVGGLDYKQRTIDLCGQIRSAKLGEPENFGCVKKPEDVSKTYSWKGAYQMVCNRLGDTWGSWYPEMFGCGKYDPQQRYRG